MMRQRGREEEQDAGGAVREDPAKGQAQRDSSERRGVSAVSRKINTVLYDRVLPLADNISGAPALTSFRFTEEELLRTVLSNIIRRECPVLASDRGAMMRAFSEAYDSEMTDGRGVGMGAIAHASPCQASSQTTAFFLEGACLNP